MDILKRPDTLSLAGNLNRIVVYTTAELLFTMRHSGGGAIVENTYTPNDQNRVEVDIKSIVIPLLTFDLRNSSTPYQQTKIARAFTVELSEVVGGTAKNTQTISFTALRAGVDELSDAVENFLQQNFLTWQPSIKPVTYYSPEFLTYYAVTTANMMCRATMDDGTTADLTLASIPAGQCWTVPVQYAVIAGKTSKLPAYYDVWMENQSGQRLTYIQRYYADDMRSQVEEWILFENSLGGVDTFRAYGDSDNTAEHTHNVVEIDEKQQEYRVDTERKHTKNTGHLDIKERTWLLDFFPSLGKYIYTDQHLREIVVTESDVNYKAKTLPSSYTFTYRYASVHPYLNLPRTDTPQEVLELKVPDVASFTIAPRLVEFPRQVLSRGALFPIQDPYSEGWGTTTMDAMGKWLVAMIESEYDENGGIGHRHDNISLLNALSLIGDYLTVFDKKISAGYADEARTLKDNEAPETITFLNGLKMGLVVVNEILSSADTEKTLTDNQLVTAKALKVFLEQMSAGLEDKYLRRDIDDTAKGVITFAKGLISQGATMLQGTGKVTDGTDVFNAVCLYAAGLAIFKTALSSPTFSSGFLGGYGWQLWMREVPNILDELVQKSHLEIDDLTVRGTMNVYELVVNQIRGSNDNFVFAGQMKVHHVDVENRRIYLDTQNGETYLPFTEGDILLVQQFGAGGITLRRYKLIVDEWSMGNIWNTDGSKNENRTDWISWSKFEGSTDDIRQGDVLTRIDHISAPERKGIVTVDSIGPSAPCVSVVYGMETKPDTSLRARFGKLDGITDPMHGNLSGYGLYGNKAFLTGEFNLMTGEDVRTAFMVQENLLASVQSKTVYDIADEDMMVCNCSFRDGMMHWTEDAADNDGMYSIDGVPLMHDFGVLSSYDHMATVAVVDGRQMLRLLSTGVTQAQTEFANRIPADNEAEVYERDENGEIAVDEEGMPIKSKQTVRNTIWIWLRCQCRRGRDAAGGAFERKCSLRLGFMNGKTYTVTGTEGDIITIPSTEGSEDQQGDICMVDYTLNVDDEAWTELKLKGYYDGSSDFRIETDGDVLIDNLAVTWNALDEYKTVITTELLQKDGIIGMYGKNISQNGKKIVEIGEQVDANKKEWTAWVTGTYANDKTSIENRITVNERGIRLLTEKTDEQGNHIASLEVENNHIRMQVGQIAVDSVNRSEFSIAIEGITARVESIEGDYVTSSMLQEKADSILLQVNQSYGGIPSRVSSLEVSVDGIKSNVSYIQNNYATSSSLTQTANEIRSEISETYGGIPSRVSSLELRADSITARVESIEGDYITSSELSVESNRILGEVSDTYGGIPSRVSSLEQTANGLTTKVQALGNPNLLTTADGSGWLTFSGGNSVQYDATTQRVYGSTDIASPMVYLLAGNNYCFSWFANQGSNARVYYNSSSSDWNTSNSYLSPTVNIDYTTTYQGYYRRYVTFVAQVSGWYRVNIWGFGTGIYRPKMEIGSVPTLYDSTIQSAIKQTAETITLTAKNINLEGYTTINGAFKVDRSGNVTMTNADVSGKITATSGTITGSITVGSGPTAIYIKQEGNYGKIVDANGNGLYFDSNNNLTLVSKGELKASRFAFSNGFGESYISGNHIYIKDTTFQNNLFHVGTNAANLNITLKGLSQDRSTVAIYDVFVGSDEILRVKLKN